MGLTPQAIIAAGAAGAVAGGVPGALAGVAATVLSAFSSSRPRLRLFAGTPKEPLVQPFIDLMRPFRRELGRLAIAREVATLGIQAGARIRDDAFARGRAGDVIVREIFFQAPIETIRGLFAAAAEPAAAADDSLTSQGGAQMVQNVVTGQEQGPAMIDRGRINEGLGNELVTKAQARAIAPIVVPVVEMSRYIPHTRIFGNGVQRSNTVIGPGPVADQALITIVGEANKQIFIRSVQVDVSPRLTGGTPQWRLRARSVVPGTTDTVLGHFFVERNDSLMTRGESIVSKIMPSFTVPEGFDYIILFELFGTRDVRVALNIDGIIIPVGVNGSAC